MKIIWNLSVHENMPEFSMLSNNQEVVRLMEIFIMFAHHIAHPQNILEFFYFVKYVRIAITDSIGQFLFLPLFLDEVFFHSKFNHDKFSCALLNVTCKLLSLSIWDM